MVRVSVVQILRPVTGLMTFNVQMDTLKKTIFANVMLINGYQMVLASTVLPMENVLVATISSVHLGLSRTKPAAIVQTTSGYSTTLV